MTFSSASHSCSNSRSCCALRFRIQNRQMKYTTSGMKATPPTTPPAIAPTLGPTVMGAGLGFCIHIMCAQVLQSWGTSEQISPSEHVGQLGVVGGHCTHRLNSECRRSSCTTMVLVAESYGEVTLGVVLDGTPICSKISMVVGFSRPCGRRMALCLLSSILLRIENR